MRLFVAYAFALGGWRPASKGRGTGPATIARTQQHRGHARSKTVMG